jgi:2'-5' RNA ligase
MKQLAVALLLPPEATQAINYARTKFGSTRARSAPPHITLIYPFAPTVPLSTIVTMLDKIAGETTPFVVSLNEFRHFEKPVRLVYLSPSDNGEIRRLHRTVSDALVGMSETRLSHFEDKDFVPHVSINDEVAEGLLPELLSQLGSLNMNLNSSIDSFCLFQNEGEGWNIAKTFYLAAS